MRQLKTFKVTLGWVRAACQLQARGFQAQGGSALPCKGHVSLAAQHVCTGKQHFQVRSKCWKEAGFQRAQADRAAPKIPGWRTLHPQQTGRAQPAPSPLQQPLLQQTPVIRRTGQLCALQSSQADFTWAPVPPVRLISPATGSIAYRRGSEDAEEQITLVPLRSTWHQHP